MKEEKTEGIVVRSQEYRENQRLIAIFTKDSGLLHLIAKRASSQSAATTVFSQIEFHYRKGSSDLYHFCDATLLDLHLPLREQFSYLQTAGLLAQTLLHSQLPGHASPDLYSLFAAYLKRIPSFTNPSSLIASFYLKLLKHEGLLPNAMPTQFSLNEWEQMQGLSSIRSFDELQKVHFSQQFLEKITWFFKEKAKG